jgi:hypothetical protein
MREIHLKRSGREDLVFVGQALMKLDDREWPGLSPNWWALSLYRTDNGSFVLESVFHPNYPRHATLYGALVFESVESLFRCLEVDCAMHAALLEYFRDHVSRRLRDPDCPLPPPALTPQAFTARQLRDFEDIVELLAGLNAA